MNEVTLERGTRMTVQGEPLSKAWLILDGLAMVSANARPLRIAGQGDLVGLTNMAAATRSSETTIVLSPVRAFEADARNLDQLMAAASATRRSSAAG